MPADHACDAKLVLIGEAAGRREDELGIPFCGSSGALLERWWEPLGLHRSDFAIYNTFPYRPPANRIQAIPREQLEFWAARLREQLAALADPWLIVPTGNVALRALFPGEDMHISDWRGSILGYTDARGRVLKVIPTIHPAATFRQAILTKFCLADWKRISEDRHFKELRIPEISVTTEPTDNEFGRFMQGMSEEYEAWADRCLKWPAMAVDIENDKKTGELLCVGFSYDPSHALVLPLSRRALFTSGTRDRMLSYARSLCSDPIPKVLQNGQHDQYILRANSVPLANYQWDLMEMDHALDPNDGGDTQAGSEGASDAETIRISMRSLAVLASLYTRFPYYKKGGRRAVTEFRWENLYNYNGMDCCVTRTIFPVLLNRLIERGLVLPSDCYSPSAQSADSLPAWASSLTDPLLRRLRWR
jgi:uracil-DNA glycosylase family 4